MVVVVFVVVFLVVLVMMAVVAVVPIGLVVMVLIVMVLTVLVVIIVVVVVVVAIVYLTGSREISCLLSFLFIHSFFASSSALHGLGSGLFRLHNNFVFLYFCIPLTCNG
jgi:hypothetical protein